MLISAFSCDTSINFRLMNLVQLYVKNHRILGFLATSRVLIENFCITKAIPFALLLVPSQSQYPHAIPFDAVQHMQNPVLQYPAIISVPQLKVPLQSLSQTQKKKYSMPTVIYYTSGNPMPIKHVNTRNRIHEMITKNIYQINQPKHIQYSEIS